MPVLQSKDACITRTQIRVSCSSEMFLIEDYAVFFGF